MRVEVEGGERERRTDQGERLVFRLGKTRVTRWDRRTDQGDQEGIGSGGTSGISEIALGAGWALVSAGGLAGEEVGDLGDRAWISLEQGGRLPSSLRSRLKRWDLA